jgi:sortase (surface protein transpeptidase)
MRSSLWSGLATVAIGLAIGLALSMFVVSSPDQTVEESSSGAASVVTSLPLLADAVPAAEPTPAAVTPKPIAKPIAIAGSRIAIPRLGIDLPLELGEVARDVPRAGYAGATPENVALVFPSSRVPGEGGNTYIYAHARVGMFLALWGARVGDEVVIYRPDDGARRSYRVSLVAPRVNPTETRWLDPSGDERLTLQTSTGPNPGDPRFIVVAYPEPAQEESAGRP